MPVDIQEWFEDAILGDDELPESTHETFDKNSGDAKKAPSADSRDVTETKELDAGHA